MAHFLSLRKAPFRHAKWPILECDMVLFSPRNGLNRTAKRAISERHSIYFGLRHRVYERPVCQETASDTSDLTFPHIYFEKIFCQNKIKKNRKFAACFFFKNVDIGHNKDHGKTESDEQ